MAIVDAGGFAGFDGGAGFKNFGKTEQAGAAGVVSGAVARQHVTERDFAGGTDGGLVGDGGWQRRAAGDGGGVVGRWRAGIASSDAQMTVNAIMAARGEARRCVKPLRPPACSTRIARISANNNARPRASIHGFNGVDAAFS